MFSRLGIGIGYLLSLVGAMFVSSCLHAPDNSDKLMLFWVLGGLFEIGGVCFILRGLSKLRGKQFASRAKGG